MPWLTGSGLLHFVNADFCTSPQNVSCTSTCGATHKQFPCSCTLAFCVHLEDWICWTSSTCADPEEKNATENSSGGSLGQGFRFSRLALSISCCFFSTPGNSAKNSPENAPFMQTSANHHSWTVQVISIRTISSLWGEFQPVVSALDSFVSGSQDHFRLLNLADKLRACATSFRNRYWIFGFYSTSAFEWYQFLWGNRKKYREKSDRFFSTETAIERPHEFTYARMSHDRVQPPLELQYASSVLIRSDNTWLLVRSYQFIESELWLLANMSAWTMDWQYYSQAVITACLSRWYWHQRGWHRVRGMPKHLGTRLH